MDYLKQQLDVLDFKYPLSIKTIRKKIKTDEKLINKNFLIKTLYKLPEYNLVEPCINYQNIILLNLIKSVQIKTNYLFGLVFKYMKLNKIDFSKKKFN
jgi:hypothetical protein